ncbi:exonuclease RecJ [Thiogranum longum]|uniref:Single-stranded-DNA-specific exonuclease RecJ n=1 Tax=Thiogranum longum TaxID=1537524 RepID=A0A4R1HAP3_9GAMM|nr:single-stranded-DNA-specific exonuclease RecJ [Thiogranum longum]TCK18408.1 exonuclease RecJ [Thiogranum longum]
MSKCIQLRAVPDVCRLPSGGARHPLLRRIYAARRATDEELERGLSDLHAPDLLKGLDKAVELLTDALQQQQRMLVVGDFDADGATSSALVVAALREMGATQIDYLVPDRFRFGYGLTPEIVEVALQRKPDLIVTVDNGISSIEGVARAREAGVRVLVTDHHLPGEQLPAADAIVNPNQPGDSFPSKSLAGVGVAFYLVMALRSRLRVTDWFVQQGIVEPNLASYLDLVALGTVADVVPLDQNNRLLVRQGLRRIRAGHCRPGIRALLDVAGRNASRVIAADFGFAVGPRLNAAGRLDDMSLGIECLLSASGEQAADLARKLDALNRERREIEADMKADANRHLDAMQLEDRDLPAGFCLYDAGWHQGVIGILASRIKEQFHRPVIVFADAGEGELKGSARSIPGLHIRDVLDAVASHHPGLLLKFGGHAMAAGLSLESSRLEDFRRAFITELEQQLDETQLTGVLETDGSLQAEDFSLEVSELLRDAGPWGQGFPEPLFDGTFCVGAVRVVGERHLKLSLRPVDGGPAVDAIAFSQVERFVPAVGEEVRAVYHLDSNEYRGMLNLQLVIEWLEPGRV